MNITTWSNFTKRRNSTRRPGSGGTQHDCKLKEATSIERPTFLLQSSDFTINYVQAFGHYYFVDDIKSVRQDLIEVSCSLDVGATYRGQIGNYTAFVERSYSYRNNFIPDPAVAMLNAEQIAETDIATTIFDATGFFVVTVLNDLGSNAGFTTYYIVTASYLKQLAAYVNKDWGTGVADLLAFFQATFLHTADAIIDCTWLPLQLSEIPSGSVTYEVMKVGVDNVTGVYGYRITSPAIFKRSWNVDIPHIYDDFRRGAPYTVGHLYIFGYGMIEINPLDFTTNKIKVEMAVDLATGDSFIELKDGSNLVSCYTYNIGVACPVGQVNANVSGAAGGLISAAGAAGVVRSVAASSPVAAGIIGVASAVNAVGQAVTPTMSAHGGKGGRAMISQDGNIRLTLIARYTTDPDDLKATQGSIFMKETRINLLSGYVKCSNAEVPIAGMESDKQAVNDMLNNGFYYE